jgi:tRNA(Arg) A34 adenosine deaminase TadA
VIDDRDTRHLRQAIALAGRAREAGDPPFGSVLVGADGTVLVEAGQRSASMDRAAVYKRLLCPGIIFRSARA